MYMMRISILVGPYGVSITGRKSTRSCRMYWLRCSAGTAANCAAVGPTITPCAGERVERLQHVVLGIGRYLRRDRRKRVRGTAGWSR